MSKDSEIARMVTNYLPIETPDDFRDALYQLTRVLRMLSDHHAVCAVCLSLAMADMLDQAVDAGRIEHEGEEHGEEIETTHAGVATRQ